MSDASQDYDPVQSNLPLELLGESLPMSSTFGPRIRKPLATSIVMPCTEIESGGVADQMLGRHFRPEWSGEPKVETERKLSFVPYTAKRRQVFSGYVRAIEACDCVKTLDQYGFDVVHAGAEGRLVIDEVKWCQELIAARRPLVTPATSPTVTKKPSFLEGFMIWLKSLSVA